MKVIKFLFFIVVLIYCSFKNTYKPIAMENRVLDYTYLKNEMIRFHFLSNSDSDFDQMIKNEIKDKVLDYLNKNGNLNGSKIENLNYITENIDEIREISENVLRSYGVDQEININIGEKFFSKRIYNGYLIPEGIYDSFIMYIGEGKGKNFWSILFTSIGFIQSEDSKNKMTSMLDVIRKNKREAEVVSLNRENSYKVKVSFKIFEVVRDIFQKIF